jgi:hypothetical protein
MVHVYALSSVLPKKKKKKMVYLNFFFSETFPNSFVLSKDWFQ